MVLERMAADWVLSVSASEVVELARTVGEEVIRSRVLVIDAGLVYHENEMLVG